MDVLYQKINHAALYNDIDLMMTQYACTDFASLNLGNFLMELNDLTNRHHIGMPEGGDRLCRRFGYGFYPVLVSGTLFHNSPVTKQYPQEMYYRLLSLYLLPRQLKKVLYLDPDILVINPLRPLWETELNGCLFAAAAHSGKTDLVNSVNRVRLGTDHEYYNSGVLMIGLPQTLCQNGRDDPDGIGRDTKPLQRPGGICLYESSWHLLRSFLPVPSGFADLAVFTEVPFYSSCV